MSLLDWDTIQSVTSGRWAVGPQENATTPAGVAIDTRELKHDQIFFAFVGQRVDGHGYLQQAKSRGAAMCIITDASRVPDGFDVPTLVVDHPTEAMTKLAAHWRSLLAGTVIGVTGSNGKTTTTRLIHSVLNQAGDAWVSSKSHNNAIGVPMSILNTPIDARFAIFELGTSSPGEIDARAQLVRPDIAVITSIGRAHLEELGSIQGICEEKASILRHTTQRAFIPEGVTELDAVVDAMDLEIQIQRVGSDLVKVLETTDQRVSFEVDGSEYEAPVPGVHNAHNAALAVLVGRAWGMTNRDIREGLENASLPEMRLDRVEIPTQSDPIVLYNDAYNANPDSTRAALEFFRALQTQSPRVVVLGDMLELGSASETEHASMLDELRDLDARVILVGEHYCNASSDQYDQYPIPSDHAMSELARTINPGDMVLLKGSRGIGLERLVYILINRYTPYAKAAASSISSTSGADS
jgi:UDP-N-acetylmuramoyl-tripeptide--D-alanyl-D-alanine ligase